MIAAAAHLPLVPVIDWSGRAAKALGAGIEPSATTVSIVAPGDIVINAGSSCTARLREMEAPLLALASSHVSHRTPPEQGGARVVEWVERASHPFIESGFSWGSVVSASRALSPELTLIVSQWRGQSHPVSHDLDFLDAAMEFIAGAARSLFPDGTSAIEWLSNKETEVLDLVALGDTVREIAERLGRSPHTVHDHLKAIHRKTGISTRGALVAAASGRRPEAQAAADTHPVLTLNPLPDRTRMSPESCEN